MSHSSTLGMIAALLPMLALPASGANKTVLYASVGPELIEYHLDVANGALTKGSSVMLPANVQYAWPHPSHRFFYVAWSNGGPSYAAPGATPGSAGSQHGLTAFRIDPATGALLPLGKPALLPSRPIHVSVDTNGTHVLTAYNEPSGVTVHRLNPDGSIGSEIKPPQPLDVGIYAHQVRVDPSNSLAFLVTRGNGPTPDKPEDPGALKVFGYHDGVLTNRASIAPGGGFNFQPRHLEFDPPHPWIFVSLERQNKLQVYEKRSDGTLSPGPLFIKETLAEPGRVRPGQAVGTLHMHPGGKFLYVANRASGATNFEGKPVFVGGENSIAVFSINETTGEPTLIQDADTRGMHPRTFTLDSSGRILIAANLAALAVRDGTQVHQVPANLAVFRIRTDGKLDFIRKYDIETTPGKSLFWAGLVSLP